VPPFSTTVSIAIRIVARSPVRHRLEYLLARGIAGGLRALPEGAADRLAARLGSLVRSPLGIRLDVVRSNLERAFPEHDARWRDSVAREAYRHLGREAAAMLRLASLSREEVVARTQVAGWEEFAAAAAEGRGLVLTTGHFGNWEVGAAAVAARGLPISAIAKRQSNPLVDAWIRDARARLGIEVIAKGDAPRRVPRALRSGRVVGFVADQDAWDAGVWVPFFGVPSSTYRGPALFALRMDAPIFLITVFRVPGEIRYRVVFERIGIERSGDLPEDVLRATAEVTARLEAAVRTDPGQYFWFHKRWKTPLPKELIDSPPGTTRPEVEGVHLKEPV
jgi:Kdo2-lipid IVA lauroyltransferase/acyltransferase